MLINKINIAKLSYTEFIAEFDKNIRFKASLSKYYDYIELASEFLLQFPSVLNLSYFKLNKKNFLFDLYYSLPNEKELLLKEYFDNLTDNGIIGQVIDLEKPFIYENDGKLIFDDVLLCPILNKDNIFGIFLLIIENTKLYNDEIFGKLEILSRLLSYILESIIHKNEISNIQGLLEQKVAERTLDIISSKNELQTILNSVNTGILVFDKDNNNLLQANSIALQLLHTDYDSIKDLYLNNFFQNDSVEYENIAFSRNYDSKITFNDLNIPILRSTAFVTLGNQKLRIESFIDITHQKEIEEKLKKSNKILEQTVYERTKDLEILVKKLQVEIEERKKIENEIKKTLDKEKELNELKSKFISLVSHEFRTPLTLINSSAQIILSYKDRLSEEDIKKYLERIMDTVDYMTGLLENVIFIEKYDNSFSTLNIKKIDIATTLKNIIKDFQMSLKNKREIKFHNYCEHPELLTDENTFRHIIYNLLTNAHKYSEMEREIIVELSDDKENFKIKIQDFGIGIPIEDHNKIYQRFFRASNVGNTSGTGLGMSVVFKSINALKGKIDFESELNKGTAFFVYLPKNWEQNEKYNFSS